MSHELEKAMADSFMAIFGMKRVDTTGGEVVDTVETCANCSHLGEIEGSIGACNYWNCFKPLDNRCERWSA